MTNVPQNPQIQLLKNKPALVIKMNNNLIEDIHSFSQI